MLNTRNKKITLTFAVLLIIGIYLNRSYSYIYKKIDDVGYQSPVIQKEYLINSQAKDSLEYFAIGDSLTAGVGVSDYVDSYPYLLAQNMSLKLDKNITLKPIGYPGARTNDLISGLDEHDLKNADIITILLGVNDVYGNVSKDRFTVDYNNLIQSLISQTDAQIYVINIPYIGDPSLILPPYNFYFNYKTRQFNEVIQQIALDNNLVYVDLYTDAKEFEKEDQYYSLDLFHPSENGYIKWASSIYENIYR